MKLYNKIFSVFFIFSSFFCFSSEDTGQFPVTILTYPKGSEAEMFSDKPEIHMLYCDDCDLFPEFQNHPFDEFMQFSSPIDSETNSERRIAFDKFFGKDKEIRLISTETIISYVESKEPERFESFIKIYGNITDLLTTPKTISEAFAKMTKVYVKELNTADDISLKAPSNIEEIEEFEVNEESDSKYYFKYEVLSSADHDNDFNELVRETSKTDVGRKSLTLFLLCHYCLGHPIFGKDLDLMIETTEFASDYPLIQADFHKINLDRYNQIGVLSIDKKSKTPTLEFRKDFYTYSDMFCHELNHAIHFILGRTSYSYKKFDTQKYLESTFLKELFCNGIEEIKSKLRKNYLGNIKSKEDLISILNEGFLLEFRDELSKKIILENQKNVSELLYEHDICNLSEIEETTKTPEMTQENDNTTIISLIRKYNTQNSFNDQFLEELASKDLEELKLILKNVIDNFVSNEESIDELLNPRYYYSSSYAHLYSFLDEEIFKKKDLVCEKYCEYISNLIVLKIFYNLEETNNILGIELINDVLFINELSDIHQFLLRGDHFVLDI
ncbi:MAG: hypothetical protein Q4E61_02480 [Alphaproteobacteria bacterium]|nr:hypothetical protein [Alphaproteobacteria bacterium]